MFSARCTCEVDGSSYQRFRLDIRVRNNNNNVVINQVAHVFSLVTYDPVSFSYFRFTGTTTKVLNLGSYNYLGFAQNFGPCAQQSLKCIQNFGIGTCSTRQEFGRNIKFLGKATLSHCTVLCTVIKAQ